MAENIKQFIKRHYMILENTLVFIICKDNVTLNTYHLFKKTSDSSKTILTRFEDTDTEACDRYANRFTECSLSIGCCKKLNSEVMLSNC